MRKKLIKIIKTYPYIYKISLRYYLGLRNFFFIRIYLRNKYAKSYYKNQLKSIKYWALKKTENDNFYYDLDDKNLQDLISLIYSLTNNTYVDVERYALEIRNDFNLKRHLESFFKNDPNLQDIQVEFGRRIDWYVFIRLMKPKLVVESGVHHGVGACLITAALMKNAHDGFIGKYVGTEIDTTAGALFVEPYKQYGEIIYGDSIKSLDELKNSIDIFINDSDHNHDYEYREYEIIKSKLTKNFIILGDNSHVSSSLHNFAKKINTSMSFFLKNQKATGILALESAYVHPESQFEC